MVIAADGGELFINRNVAFPISKQASDPKPILCNEFFMKNCRYGEVINVEH